MRETYDYYVKAFTEPSFDYIFTYLRVLLLLACVLGTIWFFVGSRIGPNEMVSLDEICAEARKVSQGDDKLEADGSTTKDTTTQDPEEMAEYRSMSLKREMD